MLHTPFNFTATLAVGHLDSPMRENISRAKTAQLTCASLLVPSHMMAEAANNPVLTTLTANEHAPMVLITLRQSITNTLSLHVVAMR